MAIIEAKKLTKIFGADPKKAIPLLDKGWSKEKILKETKLTVGVNQANFSIEAGQIFVIMGLSGSGKSTLVRLLNRLIEPTGGQVLFNGKDVLKMTAEQLRQFRRKHVGMVFQKFALFPHRTVLQNIEYGLEVQGINKSKRREMAIQSLELVGLKGYGDSYPEQLSGGMQQRVGLARGLASDPEVLLMDEAFSALDPLIRKDMQDELLELQSKMKKTIVFITHDLNEALRIGDQIALMKDGSIVQIGSPEEILMQPANKYVERFVEDVDLSKVLTASHVMAKAETITNERGPRVALQLMRARSISSLYMVDREMRLLGVITADDAARALKEGLSLESLTQRDVPTVSPDTLLNELFELMGNARLPVAVIGENGRLKGIVIKGAVLAALAGNTEIEAGVKA
ncbi:glycine betaine/proline transport system ATP-binding protein [Paenibacillus algorifonticola]|uniref:Quaternary amine transport ATP-binding protein n=1 Tax=Paenibacillus algorifonticola TaxID=684063 RepID=A0A1I2E7P8_9BACL|nr:MULTISPECIES: glycine betaine/L-proline ABC transporter ATP-binding protein [Paenibacillus]KQN97106.1 glycine/betaine ABC transporter ATP-binding protein [Paenibacillus sp. Leaf72]SFE88508.1 glycine betaine/proline transport system ATP-binding protein [Paenibacillus algorifonticola]